MRDWLRNLHEAAKQAAREMGSELKHMAAHGAHEMAATLFNGSAYVMYPKGHHDDPQIGQADHEQQHQIEREM
jgi:hypothetical protein